MDPFIKYANIYFCYSILSLSILVNMKVTYGILGKFVDYKIVDIARCSNHIVYRFSNFLNVSYIENTIAYSKAPSVLQLKRFLSHFPTSKIKNSGDVFQFLLSRNPS